MTCKTPETTAQFYWYHRWVNFSIKFCSRGLKTSGRNEMCWILNNTFFIKRRSTLIALIDLTETTRAKTSKSEKTICTFLDLSKAFNTVNHGTLLKKFEAFGAREIFLQLLASSLQNRNLFVQIDEKNYKLRDINVGVPQGSVMGPLLFLISISGRNTYNKKSQIAFFADFFFDFDISPHNLFLVDEKQLQQISKWPSANKLTLNLGKTFCLKFGRMKSMRNTLWVNEKLLKTESSNEYLVFFIDSDLKFKTTFRTSVKNM